MKTGDDKSQVQASQQMLDVLEKFCTDVSTARVTLERALTTYKSETKPATSELQAQARALNEVRLYAHKIGYYANRIMKWLRHPGLMRREPPAESQTYNDANTELYFVAAEAGVDLKGLRRRLSDDIELFVSLLARAQSNLNGNPGRKTLRARRSLLHSLREIHSTFGKKTASGRTARGCSLDDFVTEVVRQAKTIDIRINIPANLRDEWRNLSSGKGD